MQKCGDHFDIDPYIPKAISKDIPHGDICPLVRLWVSDKRDRIPTYQDRNEAVACFGIDRDDGTNSFQFYIFNLPNKSASLEYICNTDIIVFDKKRLQICIFISKKHILIDQM